MSRQTKISMILGLLLMLTTCVIVGTPRRYVAPGEWIMAFALYTAVSRLLVWLCTPFYRNRTRIRNASRGALRRFTSKGRAVFEGFEKEGKD